MRRRITPQQMETALKVLGVFDQFIQMDRISRSFEEAAKRFEELKAIAKKKYRELALQYHPDKNGGGDDKIKELNDAYDIFKKLELRPPAPRMTIQIVHVQFDDIFETASTNDGFWGGGTGGF